MYQIHRDFGELEENILASTEKINSISEMTAKIDNVKQDMTNTIEEFSEQAEIMHQQ